MLPAVQQENLWRYTRDFGADALITSGGKAILRPAHNRRGWFWGKRAIIEGCKFSLIPNLRQMGRGMKVRAKEEFAVGRFTRL